MALQLRVGAKKFQVKLGNSLYKIRNDILEEAMVYANLIDEGSKTIDDVPEGLKPLVDTLIKK